MQTQKNQLFSYSCVYEKSNMLLVDDNSILMNDLFHNVKITKWVSVPFSEVLD